MKLDAQQAVSALQNAHGNLEQTVDILSNLQKGVVLPREVLQKSLENMSVTLDGKSAGILYSGLFKQDTLKHSGAIAGEIARADKSIAVLNDTDAYRLLENRFFDSALRDATGKDYSSVVGGTIDASGNRSPNSLWDNISRKFASGLEGNVMTVTPNADARRVFAQTELPALLENSKVTKINGVDKAVYSGRYIQLTAQGALPEEAIAKVNQELVKPSSLDFIKGYSAEYADEIGLTPKHDFTNAAKDSLNYKYDMAVNPSEYKTDLELPVNKTSQNLAHEGAELAQKAPITLRSAFEAVAPVLITAGKVASFIPIVGTALGIGINTAEAAELQENLQRAIDNGDISQEALLEYNTILVGHIAQGGDPTVIMGEAGVQKAFSDWAERNNVQGELRQSLQPQSLALMAKSGAEVVADAAIDVGQFGAQKTVEGANYLASSALSRADSFYDYMSGNTARMQEIYDALPVLDTAANDDLYDPSHLDTDPIHNYPTAHDMAQIKTQIVNTQDMIEQINNGTKEPFNGMNKAESADFLQERITRLNDRFEGTYDAAKADGTLAEVTDYAAQYGAFNADKAAQSLAIHPSEPAANQSWDAPKTRALAM